MKEYRKTATVKAKIFEKGDEDGFVHRDGLHGAMEDARYNCPPDLVPYVSTLENQFHRGEFGKQYICVGVKGERWLVDKEIFEQTYEPLNAPSPVIDLESKPVWVKHLGKEVVFGFEGRKKKGIVNGYHPQYGVVLFVPSSPMIPYHYVKEELIEWLDETAQQAPEKEHQKQLLSEIMQEDEKDGLYQQAPEPLNSKVVCRDCGGSGIVVNYVAGCCRRPNEDGSCCSVPIPEPIQEQCARCEATGFEQAPEPVEELPSHVVVDDEGEERCKYCGRLF